MVSVKQKSSITSCIPAIGIGLMLTTGCLKFNKATSSEKWQSMGYHMYSPGMTISRVELHAWRGKTFGELRKTFGLPTESFLGKWTYKPRRLPHLYNAPTLPRSMPLENHPPILVVDTETNDKYPWVVFESRTPITEDSRITSVRALAPTN